MALEHLNRRGQRYYVLQGSAKTGKPKYYCSKKPNGTAVEQLPPGFEVHESPKNAIVSVRKTQPTAILSCERERLVSLAAELVASNLVIVEIEQNSLVVYASDMSFRESADVVRRLVGAFDPRPARHRDFLLQRGNYSPAFRFTLVDEEERLYSVQRWCYRGGAERWIHLSGRADLDSLARVYLPDVGQESFFDLI